MVLRVHSSFQIEMHGVEMQIVFTTVNVHSLKPYVRVADVAIFEMHHIYVLRSVPMLNVIGAEAYEHLLQTMEVDGYEIEGFIVVPPSNHLKQN